MTTLEFLTKKNKIERLEIIIRRYKLYCLRLIKRRELTEEQIKAYEAYKDKFETCLACLEDFEAKCIVNTFMHKKFYWWENYYSDAQYYRYRTKAVFNFVDRFNSED